MKRTTRTRLLALALCAALTVSLGSAAVLAEESDWLPPAAPDTAETTAEPEAAEAASDFPEAVEADAPVEAAEAVEPDAVPAEPDSAPADPSEQADAEGAASDSPWTPPAEPAPAPEDPWTPPDTGAAEPPSEAPEEEPDLSYLAGPDDGGAVTEEPRLTQKQERDARKLEQLLEQVTVEADDLDSVAFGNVEALARSRNLTVRGLEETIAGISGMDYEKLEDNLRDTLNGIARSQSMLELAGMAEPLAANSAVTSLQSTYNSLYDQFEDIRDGKLQKNNQDIIRQLRNTEDQLVMGGEALYIALVAMEAQKTSLERQLTALNRTVEEMELRYSLGQISALTLGEVTTGRSSLVSGLETLNMNLRTYKMQLQNMLGAAPTGALRLGALPAVTEKQLNAMDVEADLQAAMGKSYELYAAAVTLDDAQTAWQDAGKQYHHNENNAMYQQASHTWTAAQETYNNSLRGYELRFRTLYEKVRDDAQILSNANVSLEQQKASYAAAQLKLEQGTISQNALLSARDDLNTAEEAVTSASNTLFSDYNNYCWAVLHGILN